MSDCKRFLCKIIFLSFIFYHIESSIDFKWREIDQLVLDSKIPKSPSDSRQYRAIVLKNGLKVFLVNEPTIKFANVHLKIESIGYDEDDEKIPGLLRLLRLYTENKVLKGDQHSLKSFFETSAIFAHWVYEWNGHTNFLVQLYPDSTNDLPQTVHRLSKAVQLSPSFDRKLAKNLTIDMQHQHKQLLENDKKMLVYFRRKVFQPQNYRTYSQKTNQGFWIRENLFDLAQEREKSDLIEMLSDLQEKLFIPNNMYLVVWAPDTLDSLTQMVIESFSTIPAAKNADARDSFEKAGTQPKHDNHENQAGMAIKIPSRHKNFTNLEVQLMNLPDLVIPHDIFGFIDYCRDKKGYPGGADDFIKLVTNQHRLCSHVQFISHSAIGDVYGFECRLTELGRENYHLVIDHAFRHINAMKKFCLTNSSMYDDYYSKVRPYTDDCEVADDAVFEMNETFPSLDNLKMLVRRTIHVSKIANFPETIEKYVALFDATNLIYVLSDPNLKGRLNKIDPVTGIEYSATQISIEQLKKWNQKEPATDHTFEFR